MQKAKATRDPAATRQKLIDAAVRLMLRQGYAGTSVDQICAEAGVTKGSFFHHFENKEAISRASVDWWGNMGTALYSEAWKDPTVDPLEQIHRLFDIMITFNERADEPCLCMVGMMSQELAMTHDGMREACAGHLQDWTDNVVRLLEEAKKKHPPVRPFDPQEIGWFLNCIWQGSMLIGKTLQSPAMVIRNIRFARQWVDSLFPATAA